MKIDLSPVCRLFVQIVCDAVAVAAFREAVMHGLGMRCPMAVCTDRHGLVLAAMACRTQKLAVLGLAGGKCCKHRIMAGGAKLGRCIVRE